MQFTEEHQQLRQTVRRFIDQEINPHIEEWENEGAFPAKKLFKKMGDLGFLGIHKPEAFGGQGLSYDYSMVFAEELGTIQCAAIPMAIGVQTDMATPALARFGSDELRREFLTPAIKGEMVACVGVSETVAGSDVANIATTAKKVGSDYVINGSKMWITNACQADFICLLANTGDLASNSHRNKSLIVVPLSTKGVEVSAPFDKIGMRSSDTAQVFFDQVKVPQRYLIGEEGMGFVMQMMQFQEERLFAAASVLKGMEQVIGNTIDYTRQRLAFGKPLLDNQVIHFRLAELQTEIEALRALTYQACEGYVAGQDVTRLASMAKLKAGRLSRQVADACLQYWGGMGFMWENPVARAYRDMRLLSIGGGADEVMLTIICKLMNLLPRKSPAAASEVRL